ncbi:T9SS type A sorting domain-containing protein [Tamlana sp. 62-3]|uniref:T9SS type A sorting domain-containing protein n=1 Tax=Neotamlana sargassicola TaxID=2883125 RepID=A0A9X1I8K7_9FLAO|nr:T9SS type A sorting domain-containing protein [Tamlana sargassicola]MCB4809468.1 T9SS type A sorting domain-containing protein [Tamlana sargassicola]
MNLLKSLCKSLCFLLSLFTFSQTGPGGVGSNDGSSNLIMWYRPDNGLSVSGTNIDSWQNSAGFAEFNLTSTTTERPTLVTNAVNGYNEVSYNGTNKLYTGLTLTTGNFITNQASSFVVSRADNTTQKSSVYTTDPMVGSTRFTTHIPWNNSVYFDIGTCCSNNARVNVSGLNYTDYSIWSFIANPTTGKQLYQNFNLLQNRANTTNYTSHSSQSFSLGGFTTATNGFVGDIAEVVIFKEKVNTAQQVIINNYLAAKFNKTLANNDIYNKDNPGNGDFDHHVAGIGQATDGSNHTDSQGTGIVRINNPTNLDNDEFLFWGEESANPTYNFNTNTANYTEQLNSRWRTSKQGDLGQVDITFDITNFNLSFKQGCVPLQLVIDDNSDFSSPDNVYDLIISGNTASATNITIAGDRYFTIRYTDQIVWDGVTFYNGSGSLNAPDATDSCLKLTVKPGATANLTTNAHVREIEIENNAKLNVSDGLLLETENQVVINTNGSVDLLGEAQLIQNHTGLSSNSGDGALIIRQQGSTNQYNYNYWGAPVNRGGTWQIGYLEDSNGVINYTTGNNPNPTTTPITLSSKWLYSFNFISDNYFGWKKLETNTSLLPGIGYSMKGSGAATTEQEYIFRGTPNSGDYTFTITPNTEILVANPYPSAIDAHAFITDNLSNIEGTLYFWESFTTNNSHFLSNYQGGYAALNLTLSLPAVADVSGRTSGTGTASKPAPTQYIPPGQGFFIKSEYGGSFAFTNAQRQFARESLSESVFYKTSNKKIETDSRIKIWFSLETPNNLEKTIGLGFDENSSYNYDNGYDTKVYDDFNDIMYWSINDNEKLIIQALPELNREDTLPLGFDIENSGLYKVRISNSENLPDDLDIFIVDTFNNTYQKINEAVAEIYLNSGNDQNQYAIVFEEENTLSYDKVDASKAFVSYNKFNESLELHFDEDISTVKDLQIFNTIGQNIMHITNPVSKSINISKYYSGAYFLKIRFKNKSETESIKFIKP